MAAQRGRLLLVLLLMLAAAVAVAFLTPYVFSCGCGCLRVPRAVVYAVDMVLGGLIGAACASCYFRFTDVDGDDEAPSSAEKGGRGKYVVVAAYVLSN